MVEGVIIRTFIGICIYHMMISYAYVCTCIRYSCVIHIAHMKTRTDTPYAIQQITQSVSLIIMGTISKGAISYVRVQTIGNCYLLLV